MRCSSALSLAAFFAAFAMSVPVAWAEEGSASPLTNATNASLALGDPPLDPPFLDGLLPDGVPLLGLSIGAVALGVLVAGPVERLLIALALRAGRLDPTRLLGHPTRLRLYEYVRANPGAHYREVQRALTLSNANARWHLDRLETSGVVRSKRLTGKRVYYVNGSEGQAEPALLAAHLRNDNVRRILARLLEHPGENPTRLARALGLNPMTVRWHVTQLVQSGFVAATAEGRAVGLTVHPDRVALVRGALAPPLSDLGPIAVRA